MIYEPPHTYYNPVKPGWDEGKTPPSGLGALKPPPASTPDLDKDNVTIQTADTTISTSDFAQVHLDLANIFHAIDIN